MASFLCGVGPLASGWCPYSREPANPWSCQREALWIVPWPSRVFPIMGAINLCATILRIAGRGAMTCPVPIFAGRRSPPKIFN